MTDRSVNALEKSLRQNQPAIIGRIEKDCFIMDPRTVNEDEIPIIIQVFRNIVANPTIQLPGDA